MLPHTHGPGCAGEDHNAATAAAPGPTTSLDEVKRLSAIWKAQEGLPGPDVNRLLDAVPELVQELETLAAKAFAFTRGAEIRSWPPGFKMRDDLIARCLRILATVPGFDARHLPDGTLVTCEHCSTPHPKGDDGRPCLFPKVARKDA